MINTEQVVESIKKVFDNIRKPANVISGIIMACSLSKRPGLSCMLSVGNIIQDISKQGIPTEPLPDGTPNLMNKMVNSVICEVYRALKEDANIQTVIPAGAITVTVNGGNAGGPVTAVGTSTNYSKGLSLLQ